MKLSHNYRLYKDSIDKSRPYDDADYYYAIKDKNSETWSIYRNGLLVKANLDYDTLDDIADELEMINSTIPPKMCHN